MIYPERTPGRPRSVKDRAGEGEGQADGEVLNRCLGMTSEWQDITDIGDPDSRRRVLLLPILWLSCHSS